MDISVAESLEAAAGELVEKPAARPSVSFSVMGRAFASGIALAARGGDHLVVIDYVGDRVHLRSSDLYDSLALRVTVGATGGDATPIYATVSAKALVAVSKFLPDEAVTITVQPYTARVLFEWPHNRVSLRGELLPPRRGIYQTETGLDAIARATLSAADFMRLSRMAGFVLTDNARPPLGAVNLAIDTNGVAAIAATDGFGVGADNLGCVFELLGDAERAAGLTCNVATTPFAILLPAAKGGSDVEMTITNAGITMASESVAVYSSHVSGTFPDFSAIIPRGAMRLSLSIHTSELLGAFRIAKAAGESEFVRLYVPLECLSGSGESEVYLTSVGGSNNSLYSLPVWFEAEGEFDTFGTVQTAIEGVPCVVVSFNPKLLLRALGQESRVVLDMNGSKKPMRLRDADGDLDSWLTVFMPSNA